MKVLVTGSRDWTDANKIVSELESLYENNDIVVIEGGAEGADKIAANWARDSSDESKSLITVNADWKTHGKAAGPIRNSEMLKLGPHICLAFPTKDSKGTWDMIEKCVAAGIRTVVIGG